MALYLPTLAALASGKLNGVVFSHNRGGPYIRAHNPTPFDPNTSPQVKMRTSSGEVTTRWQGLTAAQREAWRRFSEAFPRPNRIGQCHPNGGYQEYLRANLPRRYGINCGFTALGYIDTPPNTGAGDPPQVTLSLISSGAKLRVAWSVTQPFANTIGAGLFVYVSQPMKATIHWHRSPMLLQTVVRKTLFNLTSPQDITLTTAPSAPTPVIFVKLRQSNADGRLSMEQWTRLSL